MDNSFALETSIPHLYVFDAQLPMDPNLRRPKLADYINKLISELSTFGGGTVYVNIDSGVIEQTIHMASNVTVDFRGNLYQVVSGDYPHFRFYNVQASSLFNVVANPYDGSSDLATQEKPIIEMVGCDGSLEQCLINRVIINPTQSSYMSDDVPGQTSYCIFGACAKTYRWQEFDAIRISHARDGVVQYNTIRDCWFRGVRSAITITAEDPFGFEDVEGARSIVLNNHFYDIHCDHTQHLIWFACREPGWRHHRNVFEHVKGSPYCRGQSAVRGINGHANHFVGVAFNDFYQSKGNPCRGYEWEIDSDAEHTLVYTPYITRLLDCGLGTNVVKAHDATYNRNCETERTPTGESCQSCDREIEEADPECSASILASGNPMCPYLGIDDLECIDNLPCAEIDWKSESVCDDA